MSGIFVLAELDGPVAERIRAMQQRFDPKLAAEAPPHVTLIGSSGAGPIPEVTSIELLREAIIPIAAETAPIALTFGAPMRFLQREIVVLPLDPHGPLRALHERLKESGIPYLPARWPFTPHCTLSMYPTLTPETLRPLLAQREREPWTMRMLRV
ncbi:MAG TPA: 2'-5' RNA ligase family protein, partial [Gammaproteobacteria bacterium]|nr:2'-5' RNA ligase family protein [Gammaproteobacteria bacterium]